MKIKNIYLKILILLTLFMQTASATMDYYLTYYIPVGDPQSEILDKDGVKLHKAISYTFYSEPDSAVGMITQEYIVNTPHKKRARMNNFNINLAHIKGLKVEIKNYGSKECSVVMDSSQIVSDYSTKELDKILSYVKKATKLNMKEHQINCVFKEVKASTDVALAVPKPLKLENTTFHKFSDFSSGIPDVPFLFDVFYPLGYSSDGKIAYAIEYDTDPRDMVHIVTFIQDLVTDKVLWSHEFAREGNISNVDFKSFWKEDGQKILEKLSNYKMQYSNKLNFYKEKLYYKHDALFLSSKSTKSYQKDWALDFLNSSTIYLRSKKHGQKVLDKKHYDGEHILKREPIGYIPLGERGSRRVAVIVSTVHRGWEGPPHNISYEIIGANLAVGFK